MPDRFRQAEVAALLGDDEQSFSAKLGRYPAFRRLGTKVEGSRPANTKFFDVGEVCFLALWKSLSGLNRGVDQQTAAAAGLAGIATKVWTGELGQHGDVWAATRVADTGDEERLVAETPEQLAELIVQCAKLQDRAIELVNVSAIVAEVMLAWQIVRLGADAAREHFNQALVEKAHPDDWANEIAAYRRIEARLQKAWPSRQVSPFDAAYQPREAQVA